MMKYGDPLMINSNIGQKKVGVKEKENEKKKKNKIEKKKNCIFVFSFHHWPTRLAFLHGFHPYRHYRHQHFYQLLVLACISSCNSNFCFCFFFFLVFFILILPTAVAVAAAAGSRLLFYTQNWTPMTSNNIISALLIGMYSGISSIRSAIYSHKRLFVVCSLLPLHVCCVLSYAAQLNSSWSHAGYKRKQRTRNI